jgi:hypothetical protein
MFGMALLLLVMKIQNAMYELNLQEDLAVCEKDFLDVWVPSGTVATDTEHAEHGS